ncbi:MAG: cytochrome c oxidase subunit 3 [Bacteroidota bacterium]
MDVTVVNQNKTRNKINPQKFGLLVACASMTMMFLGFMSAYIVREAAGNWYEFPLPNMFFISAGVILLSSVVLHGSYRAFLRKNEAMYKGLMVLGFVLGIAFVVLQYMGWLQMQEMGLELTTNPSTSFIYVISFIHAAHVIAGIGVLVVALVHAFALNLRVTARRKLRFEMTLIFWHFVDFLWIVLLIFFTLNK